MNPISNEQLVDLFARIVTGDTMSTGGYHNEETHQYIGGKAATPEERNQFAKALRIEILKRME